MKQSLQPTLFGLAILMILTAFSVNAEPPKTATSEVTYRYYYHTEEIHRRKYHPFLPALPSEELRYQTRTTATANINDTPDKENIVLIVVDTKHEAPFGEWNQAFLLITDTQADRFPKKKDLFKLFTFQTYPWDVPTKTIAVQSAPFIFRDHKLWSGAPWDFKWVSFRLVDLTGDGILDIWVEHAYGVAVVSFQEGEFVEVCSAYTSIKREDPIEYIDLDNDGIYEIKIPDRISIEGPTAAYPEWMSLYEWDGTTYVLNNKRFYAHNDEFLTRLLDQYTTWSRYSRNQEYHFYIGLVYFYRDNIPKAREYLQWVVENGKDDDYIHAAEDLLKKLPPH